MEHWLQMLQFAQLGAVNINECDATSIIVRRRVGLSNK